MNKKTIISLAMLVSSVGASEIPTYQTACNDSSQQTADQLGRIGQALQLLNQGKEAECADLMLEIANQLSNNSAAATPPSADR